MARTARRKSYTGIYHIMLRGADRRTIFMDDEDNLCFIRCMKKAKEKSAFELYAYCLMGNHVHLLLREGEEELGLAFKRIGVAYANYYNTKYELHGHLFQDRFRSEPVESGAYFLDALRYICQNPVKAGLCTEPEKYRWLRCSGLHRNDRLLDGIGKWTDLSDQSLREFIKGPCSEEHIDEENKRLTDREAAKLICEAADCRNPQEIAGWETKKRDEMICKSRTMHISIRQFSRLTGISKAVIERVERDKGTVPLS